MSLSEKDFEKISQKCGPAPIKEIDLSEATLPKQLPPEDMDKIFCFLNQRTDGEGIAVALAADGVALANHYCSCQLYVQQDLGMVNGSREDLHERYKNHYPYGYAMEFVPVEDIPNHKELQEAVKKCNLQ